MDSITLLHVAARPVMIIIRCNITLVIVSFSLISTYTLRIAHRPVAISTACMTVRSDVYMVPRMDIVIPQRYRFTSAIGRSKQTFFPKHKWWARFHHFSRRASVNVTVAAPGCGWFRNKQIALASTSRGYQDQFIAASNIVVYADDNRALAVNAT